MSDYTPPRNAISELIANCPAGHQRDAVVNEAVKLPEATTWPDAPYHYGMGRIREYEIWRDSLPAAECDQEINDSRARYEGYHQARAEIVIAILQEKGLDLSAHMKKSPTDTLRSQFTRSNLGADTPGARG